MDDDTARPPVPGDDPRIEAGDGPWPADPLALRLQVLLRASDLATRAMARRLDLNLTDLAALNHLMADEPMGPVELADRLDLSSASTTALADRLERAGHLVRRPHPSDRRRLVLEPTSHAQAEAWSVLEPLLVALSAAADGLDGEERAAVERWLAAATEAFLAFAADPRPGAGDAS
ncbi:MAG: MarR family transcriptional regulator [Chloroflexota bacterium]